jgi:hypothetical protein
VAFDPIALAKTFGSEEGPTTDMVKRGYHGNGVWPSDPETMAVLTEKSREVGAARRARKVAAFDAIMIDHMEDAAKLHGKLVVEANRILAECEHDNRVPTKEEMDLIKRGQVSAEKIPDRVIGKSTQHLDVTGEIDLVALVAGEQDVDVLEGVVVAEEWESDEAAAEGTDDDEDSWPDE